MRYAVESLAYLVAGLLTSYGGIRLARTRSRSRR